MTYRRSPERIAAKHEWDEFVTANGPIITAVGLPTTIVRAIDHFDDFLSHGHLAHHEDPTGFSVAALTPAQYEALVSLTESYFAAGYEWFPPLALRPIDQDTLRLRFAK